MKEVAAAFGDWYFDILQKSPPYYSIRLRYSKTVEEDAL